MGKKIIIAIAIVILAIPAGFVIYTMFGDMISGGRNLTPEERIEKRKQENQKLLKIAETGKNNEVQFVGLCQENNYTDYISDNQKIVREASDFGPGTGEVIAENFLFSTYSCEEVFEKQLRWDSRSIHHQDKIPILETDICAWFMLDKSVAYNLRFLSWKTKTGDCIGDCESYGNETAYIRIKYNRE